LGCLTSLLSSERIRGKITERGTNEEKKLRGWCPPERGVGATGVRKGSDRGVNLPTALGGGTTRNCVTHYVSGGGGGKKKD